METWRELENRFNELRNDLPGLGVGIQWGAAGEHILLTGQPNHPLIRRFKVVVKIAGEKLRKELEQREMNPDSILTETDSENLWFKGLWKIGKYLENIIYGEQIDDKTGEKDGTIFNGSIANVVEKSATFCLEMASMHPPTVDYTEEPADHTQLLPWGPLVNLLFEFDSDSIIRIVSSTGLEVDWTLTKKEEYSHLTRKRVFRPRIDKAYSYLEDEDKIRVTKIIADNLIEGDPRYEEDINTAFKSIGWRHEGGVLTQTGSDLIEGFFQKGSQHDAYRAIREIIGKAKSTVYILDNYVDSSLFSLLGTLRDSVTNVKMLTFKCPSDFDEEARRFQAQHSNITLEVRRSKDFHDRFIILDGGECYHLGASIKDSGNRAFMISKVENKVIVQAFTTEANRAWNSNE